MPSPTRRDHPATPRGGTGPRPPRQLPARAPVEPAPALPLTHPAVLIAIAAAAIAIVVSVSFRLSDTDLWHLLAIGKATWRLHRIPATNLWTWPHYGAPQVAASWPLRAFLWLLWDRAGVLGLYAWRWSTALAAFGLAWAAARAAGARGLVPLVVASGCALTYRLRSEVRPENFAAVLFALQLWILETRRTRFGRGPSGPDRGPWVVAIALVWVNTHISYHLGILLTAVYLVGERIEGWRARPRGGQRVPNPRPARIPAAPPDPRRARTLPLVLAASVAVSFLHPSGWRAVVQPFQFFFGWRNEPMYQAIQELQPLVLGVNWKSGLPLLLAGWPLLALWRILSRRGFDPVEWMLCVGFTPLALSSRRFVGIYALAAAVFVARDLQALVESFRWPHWTREAWTRGTLAAASCLLIGIPEWTRVELPLGIGFEPGVVPERACDFIAAHGVRGRAFNHFQLGGYLAYRFWPERDRLPFMTTQPENSPRAERDLYVAALADSDAWRRLDDRFRFDYLLLARRESPGERLQEALEREPEWAMVFTDDAAELFVRRGGPLAPVADSFAYRLIPPSEEGRRQLLGACAADTLLRRRAAAELERQAAESSANGSAHHLLGFFAMMSGRLDDARLHFERTLALRPLTPQVHELLGVIALSQRDPPAALEQFRIERRLHGENAELEVRFGQAWAAIGESARARAAFRRALDLDPGNEEARAALEGPVGAGH